MCIMSTHFGRAHLHPRPPFYFPISLCRFCPFVPTVAEYVEFRPTDRDTHMQIETLPPTSFFGAPFLAHGVPFPRTLFFLFTCHKLLCPSDSLYVLHPLGRFPDCSLSTLAGQKSPFPLQRHHTPGHTPLPPATLITHMSIPDVELFELQGQCS